MIKKYPHDTSGMIKKVMIAFIIICLLFGTLFIYRIFRDIFGSNVNIQHDNQGYFYIATGSDISKVVNDLYHSGYIINRSSFEWLAEKKNYPLHIKPGRYKLKEGMSNNELINMLRSGDQVPVNLVLNNIRTIQQLASKVSNQIETDSASLVTLMTNDRFLRQYDLSTYTSLTLVIPDTYQFWWNTDAKSFIERMYNENQKFWNEKRVKSLKNCHLTKIEAYILASIVEEETLKPDERPDIAGVYINRIKKGIPLQADPTIKYAHHDFEMRRILKTDLDIDSPFNTYKYKGLPPGPICIPSVSSIDAVLNYSKHQYLYFCAKDDFSGYHVFAKTLSQHNQNARKYQKALDKRRIWQ